jgi:hypothetical protein
MLIVELLKFASAEHTAQRADSVARALESSNEREFRWVLAAGLGPLLHLAIEGRADLVSTVRRDMLLAADLTARVRHGGRIDATKEVIGVCDHIGAPATLLKGISVSEQYYPAGHLRSMSDVDVLIDSEAYPAIDAELMRRGYERSRFVQPADAHHGTPLRSGRHHTWIELHTALFPKSSGLAQGHFFGTTNIAARSVESDFHGIAVRRLSPELQAAYVASSWVWDLTLCKIDPSFVTALFDAVYILKATHQTLDWDDLIESVDNRTASASLYVMLSYLARHELCRPPILASLATKQSLVGRFELRAIHSTLDHFLLGGHRWNFMLPPPVPGRYNLGHQLRKRLRL